MTIKKIMLSAVAASLVGTAAFASGTLSLNGTVGKYSNELISNTAVDANNTTALNYTAGIINASASEPGFELQLVAPAQIKSSDGNISVMDENNATVGVFDRYDPTAHSIIFKKQTGASISRGLVYKIVGDDNASLAPGAMEMTIGKGSTSVDAKLIVTDNTGVNVIDTASSKVLEGADQFAMSIDTKLDAQIDASLAFKEFHGTPSNTDTIVYTIENKKAAMTSGIFATASSLKLDVVADQNLSAYKITEATALVSSGTAGFVPLTDISLSDYNLTADASTVDANISDQLTTVLTTDKTGAMSVTNFKATGVVKFNTAYSKTLLSQVDAGTWSIYGYNAQIPSVITNDTFSTNFKFTNRSSIEAGVYFTLIDADGTTVSLNSVDNPSIASLPANNTVTYKASDLVALAANATATGGSVAGFDGAHSFSVEVSIPTTPNLVYGFASLKNTAVGQFKDLPVYNSSTMTF
jgi:hypothetical protein